jgi:hypothetical protein
MTRTVVALFDDFNSANTALRELVDNGFSRDDISLIASDSEGEYGRYVETGRSGDVETSGAARVLVLELVLALLLVAWVAY